MLMSLRVRAAAAAVAIVLGVSSSLAAEQAAPQPAGKTAEQPAQPAAPAVSSPAPVPAAEAPAAPAPDPEAPVARVNGVAVTQAEYDRNWRFFLVRSGIPLDHADKSGQVNEFRAKVLDRLVDEELLYQEAKNRKLLAGAEAVEAEMAKAREQFPTPEAFLEALAGNGLSEEKLRAIFTRNLSIQALVEGEIAGGVTVAESEIHDFYVANQESFEIPEQVRARHILLEVDEDADATVRGEKRQRLEGLLKQLKEGADFAELARANSQCPSAAEGGDLGFFGRGQMAEPFDEAAFALQPGELSGVIETPFGLHILRVEERKPAGKVPETEAAGQIREFLTSRKTEAAVDERIKKLRAGATIENLLKL